MVLFELNISICFLFLCMYLIIMYFNHYDDMMFNGRGIALPEWLCIFCFIEKILKKIT